MRFAHHVLSVQGNRHPNEDLARASETAAWVLDGATGLHKERILGEGATDAAAFVARLDGALRRRLEEDGTAGLVELLEGALTDVARDLGPFFAAVGDRSALPTAAVAMTRLRGDGLELLVLGDCRILVRDPLGLYVDIQDGRIARFERESVRALAERLEAGERFQAARESIREILREHRRASNTEGGYWVAGLNATAARRARTLTISPVAPETEVLLATDGFYRMIGWVVRSGEELLDLVAREGLERTVSLLRAAEDADPECREHPRLSPQDDASAVWLKVKPGS